MKANWSRVAGAYEQCLRAVWSESDYLPPALPGFLAEMTARLSAGYYDREQELLYDACDAFAEAHVKLGIEGSSVSDLYRHPLLLNHGFYARSQSDRRRPTPFEATVETVRRLRDMRDVETVLQPITVAALLGGSVSYGRFFNVKGGEDASDLDILLVVNEWRDAAAAFDRLNRLNMVDTMAIEDAIDRLDHLEEFARERPEVAFSAKIPLWRGLNDGALNDCGVPSEYLASLHVVTYEALRLLLFSEFSDISIEEIGAQHIFYDYRDSAPIRGDMQRAFNGRALRVNIENREHFGSYIRETLTFRIDDDDCYYPGMFQNLILLAFDVRWGDTGIRRAVESFRWKMIDRLRMEQRLRPDEYLRLSLAHTRSEVFAPHTVRSVDSSTALA